MKYVIFFIGMFLFVSCSEEEKAPATSEKIEVIKQDTITQRDTLSLELVEVIDSVLVVEDFSILVQSPMYFLPEEVKLLSNYFTDSAIVVYDSCQVLLAEAKTDTDFEYAYLKLLDIKNILANQIYRANLYEQEDRGYYPDFLLKEFEVIDEAVIGVQSTCVAECTEFDFTLNLQELRPLAINTVGLSDDLLFEIFELADGDFGGTGMGWHNWFERTWDYGGGTLFGSGLHVKVLLKINELRTKAPNYSVLMKRYQDDLLWDIASGVYMNEKEVVISELKEILALEFLTMEEKEPLNKLLSDWEANIEECEKCVSGKYQFGCQSYDCDWGG